MIFILCFLLAFVVYKTVKYIRELHKAYDDLDEVIRIKTEHHKETYASMVQYRTDYLHAIAQLPLPDEGTKWVMRVDDLICVRVKEITYTPDNRHIVRVEVVGSILDSYVVWGDAWHKNYKLADSKDLNHED